MASVSASVNLPLHHKVQTEILFWHRLTRVVSQKKGHKTIVVVWCVIETEDFSEAVTYTLKMVISRK